MLLFMLIGLATHIPFDSVCTGECRGGSSPVGEGVRDQEYEARGKSQRNDEDQKSAARCAPSTGKKINEFSLTPPT